MIHFNANFSRGVLIRLAVMGVLALGALIASAEFILDFYVRNQLTLTGIFINSGIVLLFLLGLAKISENLVRYAREESYLAEFIEQWEEGSARLTQSLPRESIIRQRYATILRISRQHAPINHNALASMLMAAESTRVSFPKFINNILILTGVFGTIVSLSIALLGASSLLDSAQELGNMDLVIHGMATALSTTMTAIVCYLFYGYFYLKLTDAQTHFLSAVEQVTSLFLLPKHTSDTQDVLNHVANLIQALRDTANELQQSQLAYAEAGGRLRETVVGLEPVMQSLTEDIHQIKDHLREGFRLPGEGK